MSKRIRFLAPVPSLIFSFLVVYSFSSHATPSGKDLLEACEYTLDEGYTGTKGMMCTWYVTPCDCSYGERNKNPRVCLPIPPDVDSLTELVIVGLRTSPELLEKDAEFAANTILQRHYPCSEKE